MTAFLHLGVLALAPLGGARKSPASTRDIRAVRHTSLLCVLLPLQEPQRESY